VHEVRKLAYHCVVVLAVEGYDVAAAVDAARAVACSGETGGCKKVVKAGAVFSVVVGKASAVWFVEVEGVQ
jgi:hypothetical protein